MAENAPDQVAPPGEAFREVERGVAAGALAGALLGLLLGLSYAVAVGMGAGWDTGASWLLSGAVLGSVLGGGLGGVVGLVVGTGLRALRGASSGRARGWAAVQGACTTVVCMGLLSGHWRGWLDPATLIVAGSAAALAAAAAAWIRRPVASTPPVGETREHRATLGRWYRKSMAAALTVMVTLVTFAAVRGLTGRYVELLAVGALAAAAVIWWVLVLRPPGEASGGTGSGEREF